jgi:hypothetical protein
MSEKSHLADDSMGHRAPDAQGLTVSACNLDIEPPESNQVERVGRIALMIDFLPAI